MVQRLIGDKNMTEKETLLKPEQTPFLVLETVKTILKKSQTLEQAKTEINHLTTMLKGTTQLAEQNKTTQKIEYEKVTVEIPKNVMDLLRFASETREETPEEWIQWAAIDTARAQLDSGEFLPTAQALAEKFSLNHVFLEILGITVQ